MEAAFLSDLSLEPAYKNPLIAVFKRFGNALLRHLHQKPSKRKKGKIRLEMTETDITRKERLAPVKHRYVEFVS